MKVLVIGESCKDVFVYCDAVRLAPDIPVPVLNILRTEENYGMAHNVWKNMLDLGLGNNECGLITNINFNSITKTRYIHEASNHMFIRVDTPHNIPQASLDLDKLKQYECIVVSDYNKGFLLEKDIENICDSHNLVIIDTKKSLNKWAEKAKFIKINNFEYNRSIEYIQQSSNIKNIIIRTDGANGCYYHDINFPTKKVDVKDSSGAGDTFMAAFVVSYIKNKNVFESLNFANSCASYVVSKRGVVSCNFKI